MTNLNVALYIRVSTYEQAEHGFSIDAQSEVLRQHCQMQKWNIHNLYIDRGISGKSANDRPALQQLLRDATDGKFQLVLVWKINRLARNTIDLLEIAEHFRKHKIALRSLTEPFETETPIGQFSLHMMAAVGELERKTIAENFRLGKQQRNKQGKYCGAQIFGYKLETISYYSVRRQVTKLIPIPQEAAIVHHIFSLYAEGSVLLIHQNDRKLTVLPVQKLTSIMSSLLLWRKKKDTSLCVQLHQQLHGRCPTKKPMVIVSDYKLIKNFFTGVFG